MKPKQNEDTANNIYATTSRFNMDSPSWNDAPDYVRRRFLIVSGLPRRIRNRHGWMPDWGSGEKFDPECKIDILCDVCPIDEWDDDVTLEQIENWSSAKLALNAANGTVYDPGIEMDADVIANRPPEREVKEDDKEVQDEVVDERPYLPHVWDDGRGYCGSDFNHTSEDYVDDVQVGRFHVGYGRDPEGLCESFRCKKCGSERFYVGSRRFFTAIKCVNCLWEACVHDG